MPCLVALLAIPLPRLAIILVVIFSDYIGNAYSTFLWPLLGFFFMPVTTLAYAWAIHSSNGGSVHGLQLVIVVLAVLLDLGIIGGASHPQTRRYVFVRDHAR